MDGGRIVAIMSWAAAWRKRTTNATQKKNKGSAVIPDGKIYVLSEPEPSFQIESVADSLLYAQIKAVVFLIFKLNYEQLSLNLILQRILQVHLARIPMLANDCRSLFWWIQSKLKHVSYLLGVVLHPEVFEIFDRRITWRANQWQHIRGRIHFAAWWQFHDGQFSHLTCPSKSIYWWASCDRDNRHK